MKIEFDRSFSKCLDKISNKDIKLKTIKLIVEIENAKTLSEIRNLKKIKGFHRYYRIKLNEFRIGFELKNNSVIRLIIISHRKDIYKSFPK